MEKQVKLLFEGVRPLLQNNVRKANPLDPAAKALSELTSKRKKTDADHAQIQHVEWLGGLYHDEQLGPYVKAEAIERSIQDGARLSKGGKTIERGLFVFGDEGNDLVPIIYSGPRDIEGLWAERDQGGYCYTTAVGIAGKKTIRSRPQFRKWMLEFSAVLEDELLSAEDLIHYARQAGRFIGIGDRRPRYGRYTVQVL
jgi:hypothetical protein